MENRDKIYDQFKDASQKAESKDFPAMDKVWERVESKLDTKVLKTENQLWKKLTIAASIMLVLTIGYQFLKPDTKAKIQENQMVGIDTVKVLPTIPADEKEAIVNTETSPEIKKDAEKILNRQLETPNTVASEEVIKFAGTEQDGLNEISAPVQNPTGTSVTHKPNHPFKTPKFDAVGVRRSEVYEAKSKKESESVTQKSEPLVVVDGKAISKDEYDKSVKQELSNLKAEEIEDVVVLKEPLYIINGVHYSEESLFGPKPTSPYAPLNQQEIETISVLEGDEAIAAYGEKGKKGVVIITTKKGRPATKATNGK